MEIRKAKILINNAGGTASKKSNNYKISLPTSWINQLGITSADRNVVIHFDGESIVISKKITLDEFVKKKKEMTHILKKFEFYDNEMLCTVFYADFTDETVSFKNYTGDPVKTAFGNKEFATWLDFYMFLEERCIPSTRSGIREYLDAIDVDEYDPLKIIEKTNGRVAEDSQWLKISDVI